MTNGTKMEGGFSDPSSINLVQNVSDDIFFANVASTLKRGLPTVRKVPAHEGVALICGSGPSLGDTLDEIVGLKEQGATIFALNGAARFLFDNGIQADFFVMLDARDHNLPFVKDDVAKTYMIASVCAANLFDALADRDVIVFHPLIDGIDGHIPGAQVTLIGGGFTVGLTSMALVHTMGYREQHLFGFDSSYRNEDLYVSPQAMTEPEAEKIEAESGGKRYWTSPLMARQAMEFPAFAVMLANDDSVISVHGSGLLPTIAWQMMRPLAPATKETEADKYRRIWELDEYRLRSPGERLLPEIISELGMSPESGTVIDFGCGCGRMTKKLEEMGYDILGVDHAENCLDPDLKIQFCLANLWELPYLIADYGICCDVMEHIPIEFVDAVLAGIHKSVPKAFFNISFAPDGHGVLIGEVLHMTVRPPSWWEERLRSYWNNVRRVGENGFVVS